MIKIKPECREHTVPLGSLNIGDTFLLGKTVCMVATRNGHPFVLDVTLGKGYTSINLSNSSEQVIPIECELSYRIK